MTAVKSEFLRIIQTREHFHQATDLDALDARAADGRIVGLS